MIGLILTIVIIGLIVYAVNRWVPMPQGFKTLVYIVGIVIAIIIVMNAFGLGFHDVSVPKVH